MTEPAAGGAEIGYAVTWLEMKARPARPRPHAPQLDATLALIRAEAPPVHYFRYLYAAVGGEYEWNERDAESDDALAGFVQSPEVALYTLLMDGAPAGLAMLDFRARPVCDLAYFGLMPHAIGRGLGGWLLGEAIHLAWDQKIDRLTVNTCTLDHPRALANYQKWGFVPVRREERRGRVSEAFLARRPEFRRG